eukprot:Polyplicarium_translucidae@DN1993_c0_g1_i2.p2
MDRPSDQEFVSDGRCLVGCVTHLATIALPPRSTTSCPRPRTHILVLSSSRPMKSNDRVDVRRLKHRWVTGAYPRCQRVETPPTEALLVLQSAAMAVSPNSTRCTSRMSMA